MFGPAHRFLRAVLLAALLETVHAPASLAQAIVKVNDTVFFQLGIQMQGWAEATQDPVSGGYSQNLFFRRIRFMVAGRVAPDVTFFVETENSRLGSAGTGTAIPTRNLATGLALQDAFGEWRIHGDRMILGAGLILLPLSRNILTSSGGQLSFDVSAFSLQANGPSQASGGRDVGLQLKGYLIDDRLEYRAGVFAGQRQAATASGVGSRNSPQYAARLQYDVFDPEKGYTYSGTNRGAKTILALGAWGNTQGDFRSWGADVTADFPVAGRSAATASGQYFFYDGGRQFTQVSGNVTTPILPRQHAFFAEAGYYFAPAALQPFLRFERLSFSDPAFQSRGQTRWGCGFNWYVSNQNLKLSTLYERIEPRVAAAGASRKNTSHFALQLQFVYF